VCVLPAFDFFIYIVLFSVMIHVTKQNITIDIFLLQNDVIIIILWDCF